MHRYTWQPAFHLDKEKKQYFVVHHYTCDLNQPIRRKNNNPHKMTKPPTYE